MYGLCGKDSILGREEELQQQFSEGGQVLPPCEAEVVPASCKRDPTTGQSWSCLLCWWCLCDNMQGKNSSATTSGRERWRCERNSPADTKIREEWEKVFQVLKQDFPCSSWKRPWRRRVFLCSLWRIPYRSRWTCSEGSCSLWRAHMEAGSWQVCGLWCSSASSV